MTTDQPDPAAVHPSERLATLTCRDGYELTYRVWYGDAPNPRATAVFLNGIMSHSAWFRPLVPGLEGAGIRMVGADRRGTGQNDDARGHAPGADQLVADVVDIARAQRPEGAALVLVGWCWGAVLAINAAHALRDELSGLMLVTPGLHPSAAVARTMQDQLGDDLDARDPEAPSLRSPIAEPMFTRGPALAGFIGRDDRRLLGFSPGFFRITQKLAIAATARIRRLRPPLRILLAQGDEATDNEAVRRAFGTVAGARFAAAPSGHGMQFDAPDLVVDQLRGLVDEIGNA